ncbi:hypothetical protein DV736_g1295, partial [Chaetothyriales sp. CBS 134916]
MEVGASLSSIPTSAKHNSLPPELVQYIHALSEPLSIYTRYMDALLIKRSDHAAFFRDLKAFRCQPDIMTLLTTPSASTPTFNTREMYLSVTSSFLASRFAHPWCRTSQLKGGWFKAEWSSFKRQDEARQMEEQKLHKLLVPIWCGFRKEDGTGPKQSTNDAKERAEAKSQKQQQQPPRRINAEAYCMELGDDNDSDGNNTLPVPQQDDASAAAKLFVGVAATGFLANNKRARKYLLKKLNKRQL